MTDDEINQKLNELKVQLVRMEAKLDSKAEFIPLLIMFITLMAMLLFKS